MDHLQPRLAGADDGEVIVEVIFSMLVFANFTFWFDWKVLVHFLVNGLDSLMEAFFAVVCVCVCVYV